MQFVRWTRVVCCCWTTGAFTSCSRWRPLPSQDVLLRRRLPNSPFLTWVAFPPHPGPLTLHHGLLLKGDGAAAQLLLSRLQANLGCLWEWCSNSSLRYCGYSTGVQVFL